MPIGPDSKRAQVDPELLKRLDAWNDALGGKYLIDIGYRSNETQQALYDAWISGRSSVQAAKPGSSKHNLKPAQAVDLGPVAGKASNGHTARDERVLGKTYGLTWPVGFAASGSVEFGTTEPWHVECLPNWTGTFTAALVTEAMPTLRKGTDGGAATKRLKAWLKPRYSYAAKLDPSVAWIGDDTWTALTQFARNVGLLKAGETLDAWGPKCWAAAKAQGFS